MKEIKRIECEIIDVDRNNELKQQKKNDAGYNDHIINTKSISQLQHVDVLKNETETKEFVSDCFESLSLGFDCCG